VNCVRKYWSRHDRRLAGVPGPVLPSSARFVTTGAAIRFTMTRRCVLTFSRECSRASRCRFTVATSSLAVLTKVGFSEDLDYAVVDLEGLVEGQLVFGQAQLLAALRGRAQEGAGRVCSGLNCRTPASGACYR
jgi:hypothetical protein